MHSRQRQVDGCTGDAPNDIIWIDLPSHVPGETGCKYDINNVSFYFFVQSNITNHFTSLNDFLFSRAGLISFFIPEIF